MAFTWPSLCITSLGEELWHQRLASAAQILGASHIDPIPWPCISRENTPQNHVTLATWTIDLKTLDWIFYPKGWVQWSIERKMKQHEVFVFQTYLQLSHDVCVCGLSHSKCFASRNKYVMNSYKLPDLICSFFSINDTLLVSWSYLWWFTVGNRYDRDELIHTFLHRVVNHFGKPPTPSSPYFFYLLFAMRFSQPKATPRLAAMTRADSRFFKIPWWLRVWMHLPGKKRYGSSTGVNAYWTNHGNGGILVGQREKIVGALKFFILSDLRVKGLLNIYSPNSQNLK